MSTIDEITLLSHLYPEMYSIPQQQGEGKRRRRRKKTKVESGDVARKRKLTQQQINALELNFKDEHKLESERKDRLAMELGLEPRQVAVWFQNRRARYKNQKLEDEYLQLKAKHDSDVAQKCQLEMEVLKLKEQLANAEKVSQNLIAERSIDVCVSSNSPSSSSFSVDTMHERTDPFLGNFAMGGEDNNIFYVPEYDYSYINIQGSNNGWVNLFDG